MTFLKYLFMLVFSLSGNCITAIMSFIAVFLQLFISLLCMGKDLFGILLFIIYVGAIAVLFLFVIMTTEVDSNVKIFKLKLILKSPKGKNKLEAH